MESLSLLEFFRRKMDRSLVYPTSKETSIFDGMKSRRKGHFGTYTNMESFEKIYNKYIKGKIYMPADDHPFERLRKKRCLRIGFVIDRDGEIDMVRIKLESVKEFLNG